MKFGIRITAKRETKIMETNVMISFLFIGVRFYWLRLILQIHFCTNGAPAFAIGCSVTVGVRQNSSKPLQIHRLAAFAGTTHFRASASMREKPLKRFHGRIEAAPPRCPESFRGKKRGVNETNIAARTLDTKTVLFPCVFPLLKNFVSPPDCSRKQAGDAFGFLLQCCN